MPCSLATESGVKYGVVTKPASVLRFFSKLSVQSKWYAVMPHEVKALGEAPFSESAVSASLPSGMSKSLCSKKCATPAGVSCHLSPTRKRRYAPPYFTAMTA